MELGLDSWTNYIAPRKLGLYTMEKVSDKLCAKGRKQTWRALNLMPCKFCNILLRSCSPHDQCVVELVSCIYRGGPKVGPRLGELFSCYPLPQLARQILATWGLLFYPVPVCYYLQYTWILDIAAHALVIRLRFPSAYPIKEAARFPRLLVPLIRYCRMDVGRQDNKPSCWAELG